MYIPASSFYRSSSSTSLRKNRNDKEQTNQVDEPYNDSDTKPKQVNKNRFNKRRNFKSDKLKQSTVSESTDGLLRLDHNYYTEQVVEFQELTEETIPNKEDTQLIEGNDNEYLWSELDLLSLF